MAYGSSLQASVLRVGETTAVTTIDALGMAEGFEAAGLPHEQALRIATTIRDHVHVTLATKDDLRTEMASLRAELKTEMADLRTELRTEMATLRAEMHRDSAALAWKIAAIMIAHATTVIIATVTLIKVL